MIDLHIKSLDRHKQPQAFSCQLNQLETVFDTLSLIAAVGNILLEVHIIEEGKRTNLSPQAFDKQDLSRPLRALQTQWEAILDQPWLASLVVNHPLLEIVLQMIDQHETKMAECDLVIGKFEQQLIRAQERLGDSPNREWLIRYYQANLQRQWAYCERAQAGRDEWLIKLTKLKQSGLEL